MIRATSSDSARDLSAGSRELLEEVDLNHADARRLRFTAHLGGVLPGRDHRQHGGLAKIASVADR
jgi:hypothetical protein